jgi:radical SAM superfamily enzyme YgiQ (UPF0313 family)
MPTPLNILLVRPHPELKVSRCLQQGFLHLEPLELEIVAGGADPEDTVGILDLSLEKKPLESFRQRLLEQAPDLVGFTGYSSNAGTVKDLARLTKELLPKAVTVVGGIHASIIPQDYGHGAIDFVVRGEGGTAFRELLRRWRAGEALAFDDRCLDTKAPDFTERCALPPPVFPPQETVPAPRRGLVPRDRYFCIWTSSTTGSRWVETIFPRIATVRTSIGCVFNCSFCIVHQLMHGKYVQRTPEDVVAEIAALSEKFIYFVDDEMFLNEKRMTEVARLLIERGIRKNYFSWARSDTIVKHPEMFKLWHQAGLSSVYVGIEAMDDERLKDYHKQTTVATHREAIRILKEIGITLHANFLVNPNFTEEDFIALEKEIPKLGVAEISFTVLSPSPGTADWQANQDKFICDPFRFYDCMHTILPTRLPLRRFYARFGRLVSLAMRYNPLRAKGIIPPAREFFQAFVRGSRYIFAMYTIHRDYPPPKN